ncbi:replication protein [Oenococcus oeni]
MKIAAQNKDSRLFNKYANVAHYEYHFALLQMARKKLLDATLPKAASANIESIISQGDVKVQRMYGNHQGNAYKSLAFASGLRQDPAQERCDSSKDSRNLSFQILLANYDYFKKTGVNASVYTMTLTAENIDKGSLQDHGSKMKSLVGRWLADCSDNTHKTVMNTLGSVASWELTFGDKQTLRERLSKHNSHGLFHFHVHIVLLVDPDEDLISKKKAIYKHWSEITGDSFKTDIKGFDLQASYQFVGGNQFDKDGLSDSISDLTKYVLKPDSLVALNPKDKWHVSAYDEAYEFLHGIKRHPSYGLLRNVSAFSRRYPSLVTSLQFDVDSLKRGLTVSFLTGYDKESHSFVKPSDSELKPLPAIEVYLNNENLFKQIIFPSDSIIADFERRLFSGYESICVKDRPKARMDIRFLKEAVELFEPLRSSDDFLSLVDDLIAKEKSRGHASTIKDLNIIKSTFERYHYSPPSPSHYDQDKLDKMGDKINLFRRELAKAKTEKMSRKVDFLSRGGQLTAASILDDRIDFVKVDCDFQNFNNNLQSKPSSYYMTNLKADDHVTDKQLKGKKLNKNDLLQLVDMKKRFEQARDEGRKKRKELANRFASLSKEQILEEKANPFSEFSEFFEGDVGDYDPDAFDHLASLSSF